MIDLFHLLNAKFAAFMKAFLKYKVTRTIRRKYRKVGRNEPCPCDSGLKYKKCCWKQDYVNGTV